METLHERITIHLKAKNNWVSINDIRELSTSAGYKNREVEMVIRDIKTTLNIGVKYSGVEYVRWYDMTQQEIQELQNSLDWFNSL
jgi:hypothetical protein